MDMQAVDTKDAVMSATDLPDAAVRASTVKRALAAGSMAALDSMAAPDSTVAAAMAADTGN
jgi:hypothetical protein